MIADPRSNEAATRAIGGASAVAAGLAVVLSPIPFADEVALLPVYAWLTLRIAHARGKRARDLPGRPLAKVALIGLGARAALGAPLAGVPGLSAAMNAATAVGLTQIYGACVDHVCRLPSTTEVGLSDVIAAIRSRAHRSTDGADADASDGAPPAAVASPARSNGASR